jgi:hypothetical protein
MKTIKAVLILMIFSFVPNVNTKPELIMINPSRDKHSVSHTSTEVWEDAQYEQSLKQKRNGGTLLGGTKQYEKELKKNDRRAHRAYLQVKKEGYAAHHDH